MSERKRKRGGSGEDDAPRCPPHPAFVFGRCLLCGAEKEAGGSGAPAVAVGHETVKQGGDGDGEGDAASCPPHPGFVNGLCSRCGAEEDAGGGVPLGVPLGHEVANQGGGDDADDEGDDDDDEDAGGSGGVAVAYLDGEGPKAPALLEAVTSIVSASDRATLMRERKLILILDLDLTLLNSIKIDEIFPDEELHGITAETIGDPNIHLYRLEMEHDELDMLTKLRPFAGAFLEQASAMFEMHVFTMGNRIYARAVMARLDPDGAFIGGRIVSRDESMWENAKSLDVIQGAEPDTVVILDDTENAWPENQENLILIDRYLYFASSRRKQSGSGHGIPSMSEQDEDEAAEDGQLAVVLGVLTRVHQRFFHGNRADVREVIAEVRRQVLPDCTLVFSYLEEPMVPEDAPMWKLAERLGAVCREDVDATVTHVVAEDPGTQKAQWARDHGRFLVTPEWIKAASFRWNRVDERGFPVTARAS